MTDTKQRQGGGRSDRCPRCGGTIGAGDRFCRSCGAALNDSGADRATRRLSGLRALGLAVIAAALLFALLYYGGGLREDEPAAQSIPISGVGTGGEGAGATQPLTARQSADLLFNQAMSAYEGGDSAAARQFIPMALTAYRELESLDLDARYHIALLSLAANLPADALAQADTMLAESPDHLLALSATGRAHAELGNSEAAAAAFRRFLDVYTPEVAASRPEYLDHARALPARREAARLYLEEHAPARQ